MAINPPPIRTELLDTNGVLTYPWQRWFNDLYSYLNNISSTGTNGGIQGATGVQGPIGPIGPSGPQGMTGIQGKNSSEAYANFIS